MAGLVRLRFEARRKAPVAVLDLAATLAIFGAEQIAQDGEQPSRHVCAGRERINVSERAQECFLHQIVSMIHLAAQSYGKRPQSRDRRQHGLADVRISFHLDDSPPAGLSNWRKSSTKRSGVGSINPA